MPNRKLDDPGIKVYENTYMSREKYLCAISRLREDFAIAFIRQLGAVPNGALECFDDLEQKVRESGKTEFHLRDILLGEVVDRLLDDYPVIEKRKCRPKKPGLYWKGDCAVIVYAQEQNLRFKGGNHYFRPEECADEAEWE